MSTSNSNIGDDRTPCPAKKVQGVLPQANTMRTDETKVNSPSFSAVSHNEEDSLYDSPVTPLDPNPWLRQMTPPRPDSPNDNVPVGAAKIPNKTLPPNSPYYPHFPPPDVNAHTTHKPAATMSPTLDTAAAKGTPPDKKEPAFTAADKKPSPATTPPSTLREETINANVKTPPSSFHKKIVRMIFNFMTRTTRI